MSTKSLLGHHDVRSSERYYNQARTTEASFEHQRRLKELRASQHTGSCARSSRNAGEKAWLRGTIK